MADVFSTLSFHLSFPRRREPSSHTFRRYPLPLDPRLRGDDMVGAVSDGGPGNHAGEGILPFCVPQLSPSGIDPRVCSLTQDARVKHEHDKGL